MVIWSMNIKFKKACCTAQPSIITCSWTPIIKREPPLSVPRRAFQPLGLHFRIIPAKRSPFLRILHVKCHRKKLEGVWGPIHHVYTLPLSTTVSERIWRNCCSARKQQRALCKTQTEDDTVNGSDDFPCFPSDIRGVQRAAGTVRWYRDWEDVHSGALRPNGQVWRLRSVSLHRHVPWRKEV